MMYRSSDGRTFSSYVAFCRHMAVVDWQNAGYWLESAEKFKRRQERAWPFFKWFLIIGGIMMFLVLTGIL